MIRQTLATYLYLLNINFSYLLLVVLQLYFQYFQYLSVLTHVDGVHSY